MTRRPWLALVVVVLIGLGATIFVLGSRVYRTDEIVSAFADDAAPCEVPSIETAHARVAIASDEVPLRSFATDAHLLAIAPKTSPPCRDAGLLPRLSSRGGCSC